MSFSAALLSSCSNWEDGIVTDPAKADLAIEFETATSRKPTRADGSLVNINETWLPKSGSYYVGLFGYYTGQSTWAETTTPTADIFYNTKMSIDAPTQIGSTGNYYNTLIYPDKRFWPNDGGKMSFWAYYPWNPTDDPGAYGVALTKRNASDEGSWGIGTGEGMGSIRFTMHPDAAQQNDFLISDLVADRTKANYYLESDGVPNRVSLRFRHMLAQVRLYAFVGGIDQVEYVKDGTGANVAVTTEMLANWEADNTATVLAGNVEKKYFRNSGTTSAVPEGGWLQVGDVVDGVTITEGNITTYGELKPAVLNTQGIYIPLNVGDPIPDESKSARWERRDGVWNVDHTRQRANITYSMSFNNIKTTAIFTPQYSNGETVFTCTSNSALGSATVNHYIMNPYWFRFQNGQRVQLNTTYMYRYFEDTYAGKATTTSPKVDESGNPIDGSGIDWSSYGKDNVLGYQLTDENKNTFDSDPNKGKHYNYAPGNIIMAVPQVMDDNNVPNIVLTATAKDTKGNDIVSRITINMIGQGLKWESGFIYSYAFLENDLLPNVDIVRGPESITLFFDPSQYTDQW